MNMLEIGIASILKNYNGIEDFDSLVDAFSDLLRRQNRDFDLKQFMQRIYGYCG